MGLVPFTVTVFVLGFFMALGKAAVYKHIPVYYPNNVGSVGGLVGMIGGLGGFVLPIAFGALIDLTGVWTSCFMLLFLLVAGCAALDAHRDPARWSAASSAKRSTSFPNFPRCRRSTSRSMSAHCPARCSTDWRPEDKAFWETTGRAIARRNLWISIPALLLSFAVWQVWSVVVAKLPSVGFNFTTDQLFWLAALPGISGAVLRIFYSFMVPIFGGRLWTTLATWSLMIPAVGIGYAVQNPTTPYLDASWRWRCCAASAAAISPRRWPTSRFFFPKAEKGNALALNAGLGNLGVSVVQFVVPIVITVGVFGWFGGDPAMVEGGTQKSPLWLQNAGFIWVPFIVASAFAAWFGMNDIASAKASFAEQAVIFQRKHNWIMCWLYTGTFGSFIGYSAGFPLLAKTQFPAVDALQFVFLGPLVGALSRSATGWIADKWGGGARHLLGVHPDDARRARRALLHRHQGSAGRVLGLLRDVPGAVLRNRRRQCLDLPDDPQHHAQGDGPADADGRRRDPPAAGREGIGRDHRLHLGDRSLRRLLHPEVLRHLDRAHRRRRGARCGASSSST